MTVKNYNYWTVFNLIGLYIPIIQFLQERCSLPNNFAYTQCSSSPIDRNKTNTTKDHGNFRFDLQKMRNSLKKHTVYIHIVK